MKKTLFKSVLCATLFVGALTSCNDIEDLYNPELVREQAKKALGLDIAADQDWNMTSVVTANFTLNEDALSDYSFRIYTANPFIKNSGAVILADHSVKTDANGNAKASFKFEMPSYLEYVYVARVDNHGRRLVGIANVMNKEVVKSFGVSAATRAGEDTNPLYTMDNKDLYSETEVTNLLASAKVLVQNGNNDLNGVTKVQGTFDGSNLNYYLYAQNIKQNVLIIDNGATLNITQSRQYAHIDIVVANGGTLNISNEFKLNPRCRLIVMPGGVVNHTQAGSNGRSFNFEYDDTNSSCIYNAGTINMVGTTYLSHGGKFYNASTGVVVADIITTASANDVICNYGRIQANAITSNNGSGEQGTLHNGCLIRCENIRVYDLNLAANSALEDLEYLCVQNIYLRQNSIIRVNGQFEGKNNISFNYLGDDSAPALFSANEMLLYCASITVNNQSKIFIERNIISTPTGTNQTHEDYEKMLLNAAGSVAKVGEAPVTILPSKETTDIAQADCIGNGNKPTTTPEPDPTPAQTYTYAFEDLDKLGGDYDMNDVVLKCTGPTDGKITIRLVAVGAAKNLRAFFNKKPLFNGQEVHAALGVEAGTITNTSSDYTIVDNVVEETITVEDGFLFTDDADIYIVDEKGRESHIPNFDKSFTKGGAPYAICVPYDWKYPREFISIITAYPPFVYWAGDVNEQDWYTADKAVLNNVY